jgi:hypothetical protein
MYIVKNIGALVQLCCFKYFFSDTYKRIFQLFLYFLCVYGCCSRRDSAELNPVSLLGLRACEFPQPETQTAQDHEGQRTWPQWHQMASHQHFRAYDEPRQLRYGH